MSFRDLYKTKLCHLFQRGHCDRANCTFAHGEAELRPVMSGRPQGFRDRFHTRQSPSQDYPGRYRAASPPARKRGRSRSPEPTSDHHSERSRSASPSHFSGERSGHRARVLKRERKLEDDRPDAGSRPLEDEKAALLKDISMKQEHLETLASLLGRKKDLARDLASHAKSLEEDVFESEAAVNKVSDQLSKLIKAHQHILTSQDDVKRFQSKLQKLVAKISPDDFAVYSSGLTALPSKNEAPTLVKDDSPMRYALEPPVPRTAALPAPVPVPKMAQSPTSSLSGLPSRRGEHERHWKQSERSTDRIGANQRRMDSSPATLDVERREGRRNADEVGKIRTFERTRDPLPAVSPLEEKPPSSAREDMPRARRSRWADGDYLKRSSQPSAEEDVPPKDKKVQANDDSDEQRVSLKFGREGDRKKLEKAAELAAISKVPSDELEKAEPHKESSVDRETSPGDSHSKKKATTMAARFNVKIRADPRPFISLNQQGRGLPPTQKVSSQLQKQQQQVQDQLQLTHEAKKKEEVEKVESMRLLLNGSECEKTVDGAQKESAPGQLSSDGNDVSSVAPEAGSAPAVTEAAAEIPHSQTGMPAGSEAQKGGGASSQFEYKYHFKPEDRVEAPAVLHQYPPVSGDSYPAYGGSFAAGDPSEQRSYAAGYGGDPYLHNPSYMQADAQAVASSYFEGAANNQSSAAVLEGESLEEMEPVPPGMDEDGPPGEEQQPAQKEAVFRDLFGSEV